MPKGLTRGQLSPEDQVEDCTSTSTGVDLPQHKYPAYMLLDLTFIYTWQLIRHGRIRTRAAIMIPGPTPRARHRASPCVTTSQVTLNWTVRLSFADLWLVCISCQLMHTSHQFEVLRKRRNNDRARVATQVIFRTKTRRDVRLKFYTKLELSTEQHCLCACTRVAESIPMTINKVVCWRINTILNCTTWHKKLWQAWP